MTRNHVTSYDCRYRPDRYHYLIATYLLSLQSKTWQDCGLNTIWRQAFSMNTAKKKSGKSDASIAENRKARYDYHIEDHFEAGLCLEGWEVKSLRAGQASLTESYAFVKNGEAWLTGCHITPLTTASTHINPEPRRMRKLLLNRVELDRLTGAVERKGYTLVPLSLYWNKGRAKLRLGLAKGKQQHDKRADDKDRDWKRQQARIMKH
jgi:SsrA-binding protein